MATFSNIKAFTGLYGNATSLNPQETNEVQVGTSPTTTALSSATKIISLEALIVGSGSDLVIDISDLDNTGSTAWTAGESQLETATAAGTITADGNAAVVVTAVGMTGSPKTINVPVLNGDTAAVWAGKVRTALAADADVSALFTVSGATTLIILTRKPIKTYTLRGLSVPLYPADDGTLNISLDNGTCTGITTAATSANTRAGVLTVGAYAPDLDGNDVFGDAGIGVVDEIYGLQIFTDPSSSSSAYVTQSTILADLPISPGGGLLLTAVNGDISDSDITIEPDSDAKVIVTIATN